MGWTWTGDADTLPTKYRQQAAREAAKKRRALALASAESAGRYDARGDVVRAAQAWADVEDLMGGTVPRELHRARRRAELAESRTRR